MSALTEAKMQQAFHSLGISAGLDDNFMMTCIAAGVDNVVRFCLWNGEALDVVANANRFQNFVDYIDEAGDPVNVQYLHALAKARLAEDAKTLGAAVTAPATIDPGFAYSSAANEAERNEFTATYVYDHLGYGVYKVIVPPELRLPNNVAAATFKGFKQGTNIQVLNDFTKDLTSIAKVAKSSVMATEGSMELVLKDKDEAVSVKRFGTISRVLRRWGTMIKNAGAFADTRTIGRAQMYAGFVPFIHPDVVDIMYSYAETTMEKPDATVSGLLACLTRLQANFYSELLTNPDEYGSAIFSRHARDLNGTWYLVREKPEKSIRETVEKKGGKHQRTSGVCYDYENGVRPCRNFQYYGECPFEHNAGRGGRGGRGGGGGRGRGRFGPMYQSQGFSPQNHYPVQSATPFAQMAQATPPQLAQVQGALPFVQQQPFQLPTGQKPMYPMLPFKKGP